MPAHMSTLIAQCRQNTTLMNKLVEEMEAKVTNNGVQLFPTGFVEGAGSTHDPNKFITEICSDYTGIRVNCLETVYE